MKKTSYFGEVLHGDCRKILADPHFPYVDLIYMDPPFFTRRVHKLSNRSGERSFSFADVWEGLEEYTDLMAECIKLCYSKLRDSGSLFIHCDRNSSHVLRTIADATFSPEHFQSEIIWSYKRWSNSKAGLMPAHQTILFYSKTKNFKFNRFFTSYSQTTNVDQILQKRTRDKRNKAVYKRNIDGGVEAANAKTGVPLSDVWEIPYLNPKAKERVGYPTQKPVLLLERIIELATDEGDTVCDPFCGSGTTLVAAELLGRKHIGVDQNIDAVELARARLAEPRKTTSALLKNGQASYWQHDERLEMVLRGIDYDAVQRNKGIDAILREKIAGKFAFVRLQREGECPSEAVAKLESAVRKRGGGIKLFVKYDEGLLPTQPSDTANDLFIVDATSLSIHQIIQRHNWSD